MAKERYENLDGMRAYACIGIVLMHVLSNGRFGVSGFVFDRFIPSLTHLTFFFMLLSAFSMCCGYYERFKNGSISLDQFYKRRFARIWPFFAILCTVELILDHRLSSLYEWFADLTLAFGLLPNANISVVGVGWFLGVVFAFYMIFPFFVFLMGNKKRAWMTLGITVIFNILCQLYFFDETHVIEGFSARSNLIYSAMFFVVGGMVYLYRNIIREVPWIKWLALIAIVAALILYYTASSSVFLMLLIFILLCILGITMGGETV